MLKIIFNFVSGAVLLVVSSILAFLGKTEEMGLSVLAGAIGLFFANIDRIRKLKGAGFEAETWEKVEAVVVKETEPEPETATTREANLIDGGKRIVLAALANPKYTWRFLGGVAEETGLSKAVVSSALTELVQRGLVIRTADKSKPMWALTSHGRRILQSGDNIKV